MLIGCKTILLFVMFATPALSGWNLKAWADKRPAPTNISVSVDVVTEVYTSTTNGPGYTNIYFNNIRNVSTYDTNVPSYAPTTNDGYVITKTATYTETNITLSSILDIVSWDIFNAIEERFLTACGTAAASSNGWSMAIETHYGVTNKYYRFSRDNLIGAKTWISNNFNSFVDTSYMITSGVISFDGWFANTLGEDEFPTWQSTQKLLDWSGVNTGLLTCTPHRDLLNATNGWWDVRRVLTNLVWVQQPTSWARRELNAGIANEVAYCGNEAAYHAGVVWGEYGEDDPYGTINWNIYTEWLDYPNTSTQAQHCSERSGQCTYSMSMSQQTWGQYFWDYGFDRTFYYTRTANSSVQFYENRAITPYYRIETNRQPEVDYYILIGLWSIPTFDGIIYTNFCEEYNNLYYSKWWSVDSFPTNATTNCFYGGDVDGNTNTYFMASEPFTKAVEAFQLNTNIQGVCLRGTGLTGENWCEDPPLSVVGICCEALGYIADCTNQPTENMVTFNEAVSIDATLDGHKVISLQRWNTAQGYEYQ